MFTSAYRAGTDYATEVAPGLGAPYHQHLFSARLDMMVDGFRNAVEELDSCGCPRTGQPLRQRLHPHGDPADTESEGGARRPTRRGRVWQVGNPDQPNRLGQPVGLHAVPAGAAAAAGRPGSSIAARAAFATQHLWVTPYDPTSATRPATSSTSTRAAAGCPP